MSVLNEIDRITQNISNTYAVLEALGCDMPDEQNSDNLAPTAGTSKVVLYNEQTLTEEQQTQARTNIGAASAEDVSKLSEEIDDYIGVTIPDYWKEYIDGRADDIKEKLDEGGVDSFSILWGTDIHGKNGASNTNGAGTSETKNIGIVSKYTMDKYNIPFVLFSGDIQSQASHTAEESVHAEYDAVNEILSPIDKDRLLVEKGNHDGAWGSPVDGVYYLKNIGGKKIYNHIFRRQALDRNRVFGGDGTYFYVDSPQKVRIIMLNGHTDGDGSADADGNAVYNSMKNGVYGTEQLQWLCNVALNVPNGTRIIVSAHQPFSVSSDGALLAGILEAYNKRITYSGTKNVQGDYWGKDVTDTTYTNVSVNADFTEAKGNIVIYLHGHIHKDSMDTATYSFATASITTAGADVRDTDPPLRTPGTATETALDLVIMSKTAINFLRIGAGSDRVIALDDTVYYSIKNNLTNAKTSNSAANIVSGNSYTATISANSGYELDSVTVTMGGTDVTSEVYADGVITISEVTGNVIITASAVSTESGDDSSSDDTTTTGYTNLFDTTATGFVDETSKFYTNWLPYNGDDNDGNGTIYHFKGLVYGAGQLNPYKMSFATDANGSNATSQFYCTAANKQAPVAADYDSSVTIVQHQTSGYTHVRFEIREALPDNLIITANENIVDD